MTTPLELYSAIQARVKAATGLSGHDFVPDASLFPSFFVLPPEIDSEGLADDWQVLRFEVIVLVSTAIDVNQLKLLEYQAEAGEHSVPAAFAQNPSLGFPDVHARVPRSRPLGYEEQAGYQGFGCAFEVVVRLG